MSERIILNDKLCHKFKNLNHEDDEPTGGCKEVKLTHMDSSDRSPRITSLHLWNKQKNWTNYSTSLIFSILFQWTVWSYLTSVYAAGVFFWDRNDAWISVICNLLIL